MSKITEALYRQIVLKEMEGLVKEQEPIRFYFAPGNATYQQISMLSVRKNLPPRAVVELAVKALFLAIMEPEQ